MQTFGDGSQTTWEALVVAGGIEQVGGELELRAGRWWAGGRPRGSPIGEWHATQHQRTASAGRSRLSLSRSPRSARSHSPEHEA